MQAPVAQIDTQCRASATSPRGSPFAGPALANSRPPLAGLDFAIRGRVGRRSAFAFCRVRRLRVIPDEIRLNSEWLGM